MNILNETFFLRFDHNGLLNTCKNNKNRAPAVRKYTVIYQKTNNPGSCPNLFSAGPQAVQILIPGTPRCTGPHNILFWSLNTVSITVVERVQRTIIFLVVFVHFKFVYFVEQVPYFFFSHGRCSWSCSIHVLRTFWKQQ